MAEPAQRLSERKTILVVDDDPMMVDVLTQLLEREFEVVSAGSGAGGLAALEERGRVDAIVADQRMPGMTGVEMLAKALAICPDATRVMVTATDSVEEARDAVNIGHVDRFISKPIRPMELLEIIKGAMRERTLEIEKADLFGQLQAKNVELEHALAEVRAHEKKLEDEVVRRTRELRQLVKQLEELALRDGLTGLFNHRYFQETLNAEIARAIRYGRKLSLVFLDVDNFKNYNDGLGHLAGDALLKQLSKILSNTGDSPDIRARGRLSDIPCRYGGEEFVIILPESDKNGALVRAERVRVAVEEYSFEGREKQPAGKVTISVGIAAFPDDAKTKQELIQAADDAMLRAKRAGKNRVVVAGV